MRTGPVSALSDCIAAGAIHDVRILAGAEVPIGDRGEQGTKQGIITGTEYRGSVEITRHDELALEHNNPDLYPLLIAHNRLITHICPSPHESGNLVVRRGRTPG